MAKKIKVAVDVDAVIERRLSLKRSALTMKCDLASLEFPFFSWVRGGENKVRVLEDPRSGAKAEIHPSNIGSASMWDQEILIYLFTLLVQSSDEGVGISRKFTFKASDLLKATKRGTSGPAYEELENAFVRLAGTRVKTNIKTGGQIELEDFSFIESYLVVPHKSGVMEYITVAISNWCFRSITSGKFIGLPKTYFDDKSPRKRRLYQLVRKHCGQKPMIKIKVKRLYEKSGSESREAHFKFMLKKFMSHGGHCDQLLFDHRVALLNGYVYGFPNNEHGNFARQKFHMPLFKIPK